MRPLRPVALLMAAFGAGSLLAAPAWAQPETPAITVTGEATVSAPPDLAQVEAGVASEARTARAASEANNTTMGQLLLALKAAGIDGRDIQTSRVSLQPQSSTNRSTNAIMGYRAGNQVTVRLHDVSKVASTIDLLVGAGANEIGGVSFMVSQASKLLDDARERAVADARRKAEIYAKAAGVTLGAPISISEGGSAGPVFHAKMAAGLAAPTPLAPGEETLSVTVSVSWAIKQGQ